MKFIVIGLGGFGSSLAVKLTAMGHEVIGVDKQMEKIESFKDKVTQAICLDCKNQESVKNLPLKNTDVVVVSIGEDEGANILTSALMKKMKVVKLVSRAVSPLHETVLEAMEVNEIVRPEEEAAERWARKLTSDGFVESFELTDEYSIIEMNVPAKFVGKTVKDIEFNKVYNVIILTVLKNVKKKGVLGIFKRNTRLKVKGIANADTVLEDGDVMVLYGYNNDLNRILKEK